MSLIQGIEYNLASYLKTAFPSIGFEVNGYRASAPNDCVKIDATGGIPNHYFDRQDYTVQITSRAEDKTIAKKNIYLIYNAINDKFGLTLPEETVGGENFPVIKTWRIIGVNTPSSVGSDENGKHLFSVNFIITTE